MCVLVYTTSAQLKRIVGVILLLVFAIGLVVSAAGYVPPYSVSDPNYPRAKRFYLQVSISIMTSFCYGVHGGRILCSTCSYSIAI